MELNVNLDNMTGQNETGGYTLLYNVTMGYYDNVTNTCPDEGDPPGQYAFGTRIMIVITLMLIMALTLMGNILVVMAVLSFRQMRTSTNWFIVSLAFADIFVAIFVMPLSAYTLFSNLFWKLGSTFCLSWISLDIMNTTASILHLSCLALDRYFAICHPFYYHQRMNKRTVLILVVTCWSVAVAISWVPIMNGWHAIGLEEIYECRTPDHGNACIFIVNIPFAIVCSLIAFYAPTVFMFVLNIRIYLEASNQARQIQSLDITGRTNVKAETKAAKTLTIIMGAFCICWCPFFICNIIDPFINYAVPFSAWTVFTWLGYVNSTLNPFLYYAFNRKFRVAMQRLMPWYRKRAMLRRMSERPDSSCDTMMTKSSLAEH